MSIVAERDRVAALAGEVVAHLNGVRERLAAEIRTYPTPITRCDAQFNHLYEQRARLAAELDHLVAAVKGTPSRERCLELIGRFVASEPYLGDSTELELRRRLMKELDTIRA